MSAEKRPESTYLEGLEKFSQGENSSFSRNRFPPEEGVFLQSTPPNQLPHDPLDEDLLDRLVDGELPEAQQQEVLRQVQCHPDGWRRLALAFLEAQTWRREMPRLLEESLCLEEESLWPDKTPPPPPEPVEKHHGQTPLEPPGQGPTPQKQSRQEQIQRPAVRPGAGRPVHPLAWQILALAGGILMAFLGGYWSRDVWHTIRNRSQQGFVVQGTPLTDQEHQQIKSPSEHALGKEGLESPGRFPSSGWEYITLAAWAGPDGVPEIVRIPVFPAAPQAGFPPPMQPPIPEELLHLLRRWGAEVSHSRQLVPLRIQDGRQIVIPVEQVELYYRPQAERFQ